MLSSFLIACRRQRAGGGAGRVCGQLQAAKDLPQVPGHGAQTWPCCCRAFELEICKLQCLWCTCLLAPATRLRWPCLDAARLTRHLTFIPHCTDCASSLCLPPPAGARPAAQAHPRLIPAPGLPGGCWACVSWCETHRAAGGCVPPALAQLARLGSKQHGALWPQLQADVMKPLHLV